MISEFQKGSPGSSVGVSGSVIREWINKQSVSHMRGLQTQLQFNETAPPSVLNRASHAGPPSPIVIERLVSRTERRDDVESCASSLRLSVLSEERLRAAVRLAKRDLRVKRHESVDRSSLDPVEISENTGHQRSHADRNPQVGPNEKAKTAGTKKQVKPGPQVLVYTPQKPNSQAERSRSAPTEDQQLSQEIRKLQKELGTYIQRIEQLDNKGRAVEVLEPDEKRRMEIRRQEQSARSARIIYMLQRQVKEIQEDLDKLRSQNIKHTKKSRAMDRLAAAHRGAVRAMQVFIHQLSDPVESTVPTHCKELGQLIRQLSLCSAKVEVGQGSAVPETALDILQKLETLDSALSKKERLRNREPGVQDPSPEAESSSRLKARSTSPPRPARHSKKTSQRPHKPTAAKKPGGRLAGKPHRTSQALVRERSEILKAGLESLINHQKVREAEPQTSHRTADARHPNQRKQVSHVRDVSFQQPTVSSRLRENQLPPRETTVPWIPTSPHSPSRQRAVSSRPEPRCLFSPPRSPEKQKPHSTPEELPQHKPSSQDKKQAENEALREAWLDRVTSERLRELNRLSKEEADRINKLRTTVGSPTQWAERAERAARERLQPLLDQAQQVVGTGRDALKQPGDVRKQSAARADVLSEALLEDLLEDTARVLWAAERQQVAETAAERQLQGPTLESMLLRMEEMERDQEEVRRRFAMISYSDPLTWEKVTDRKIASSRPASPQPIRLTKPILNAPSTADIVLQRPVETGAVSDTSVLDEESLIDPSHTVPARAEKMGSVHLRVPTSMQQSIQKYRENHDAYLRLVSHEALGHFNPWAIADSLADELMTEALADVAAEFQDVCEEYAEAVFTSEFLQPVQSPTTSVS